MSKKVLERAIKHNRVVAIPSKKIERDGEKVQLYNIFKLN